MLDIHVVSFLVVCDLYVCVCVCVFVISVCVRICDLGVRLEVFSQVHHISAGLAGLSMAPGISRRLGP